MANLSHLLIWFWAPASWQLDVAQKYSTTVLKPIPNIAYHAVVFVPTNVKIVTESK
jgi:hypothetical protein